MRWKQHRVVGAISILLALNISAYKLTMASTTENNLPAPIKSSKFQSSHLNPILQKATILSNKYKDEGLTVPVIMGLIEVESELNPKSMSKEVPVSYGLMQVLRATATPIMKDLGYKWSVTNILNPDINMEVGVEHLMDLHRHFVASGHEGLHEFHVTLIAYNRGERAVRDSLRSGYLRYLGKIKVASRKY